MFDKFANFISMIWEHLLPFFVIDQVSRGIVLRFGKFHREVGPGFHFKVPFMDEVWEDIIVPRTLNLDPQTLSTNDEKVIVVGTVMTVEIVNVRKSMLNVEGVDTAMTDICYGIIGEIFQEYDWKEIKEMDLSAHCVEEMNKVGGKYGLNILNVQFSDLACIRSYRLITD